MIDTNALCPPRAQLDRIDGEWEEPVPVPVTLDDPNTGVPRQHQTTTAHPRVERALAAAAELHTTQLLANAGLDARIALLDLIAAGLTTRVDELAVQDAMASGNPLRVAAQMASYLGPRVLSARDQLLAIGEDSELSPEPRPVRLLRRPLGPAVVLAPWNAPTFVAVAKVASALAAGCPVILKPSEWAPAGCQILAEVVTDALRELDLPANAFQLVHGAAPVGGQLAADPRVRAISFTGGGPGGRAVAAAAAPQLTMLQLELGGHNPAVVHPDADVAATAAALATGMTKLNGQWCEAPGKILAPEELYGELVDALLDNLSTLRLGHCLDSATDVGPLAYAQHRDRLQEQIDALIGHGGKALVASERPELGGWFFEPTVVVGLRPEQSTRELFGPAVTVHRVASKAAAIAAADGPETGLAGFVFGRDLAAAMHTAARLPVGEVRVNGCNLADLADGSEQSFWNSSGIGGHGPTDMVRFFQGRRTIGVDDLTLPV
jgi:phenylacetaldehyde dehydrogenase